MKITTRLGIVLAISFSFFCVEIAIGFRTKSLALIADAFHYLNDVVAYVIAFVASYVKDRGHRPPGFTYAFHRAELVGAFFNGVFLLALALSIFLQSIERFIRIEQIDDPVSVLIVGSVGLTLNVLSALVLHDHSHGDAPQANTNTSTETEVTTNGASANALRGRTSQDSTFLEVEEGNIHALHNHVRLPPPGDPHGNLGVLGVLIHVMGDAVNNIGVIIAAIIIWQTHSPSRFYADPAVSMIISFIIFASAIPLTKRSGRILLEAAPVHLDLGKIQADLLALPGVLSIHDLHVWHLSQTVIVATFHVLVSPSTTLKHWETIEGCLRECMGAYGVTHVTVAPEVTPSRSTSATGDGCVPGGCNEDIMCGADKPVGHEGSPGSEIRRRT